MARVADRDSERNPQQGTKVIRTRGPAKRPITRRGYPPLPRGGSREQLAPPAEFSREQWASERGQHWATRLYCWSNELDRLRWAEDLPNLPYFGEDKPKPKNPVRRRELERVFAAVANILDDSRAATLLKHERDRFDVECAVTFAEEMLRRIAAKMHEEPFPRAEYAAEVAIKEYAGKVTLTDGRGHYFPAGDVSPFDRMVVRLAVRELDRLGSHRLALAGPRTPFRTLARAIAAEVLDLPEHTVRRLLR